MESNTNQEYESLHNKNEMNNQLLDEKLLAVVTKFYHQDQNQ